MAVNKPKKKQETIKKIVKKVVDKSEEKDLGVSIWQKKLYIFTKNSNESRIIIAAESLNEAKELLFGFDTYADYTYNLNNFEIEFANSDKVYEIVDIDRNYQSAPFFINEHQYDKLKPYIKRSTKASPLSMKGLSQTYNELVSDDQKIEIPEDIEIPVSSNLISYKDFKNTLEENDKLNDRIKRSLVSFFNKYDYVYKTSFKSGNGDNLKVFEIYSTNHKVIDVILEMVAKIEDNNDKENNNDNYYYKLLSDTAKTDIFLDYELGEGNYKNLLNYKFFMTHNININKDLPILLINGIPYNINYKPTDTEE